MMTQLAAIAFVLASSATAGNFPLLLPTQERIDFVIDRNALCVIEQDLFSDGFIYNTAMLNAEPTEEFASAGTIGLAFDPITRQRWHCFEGGYFDVAEGDNISNPISGVQAMAAYDNHQFFLNDGRLGNPHHYDLAIRDGTNGAVTIYTDAFQNAPNPPYADIASGMSVETGPDGRQVLILSNGNQIFQFHISEDWRTNATFRPLSIHNLGGNLALGIYGLDYSNGFLYVVTLAGIGEYPYQLLPANATCPQDFNNDLQLDFFDVSDFLNAFMNYAPAADFTGDGNFDFFDVSFFLAGFSSGCP